MTITEPAVSTDVGAAISGYLLRGLLRGGLVAAGTDHHLPILHTVRLYWDAEGIHVEATDRYRLVQGTLPASALGKDALKGEFSTLLDRKHVTNLIRCLPSREKYADEVSIEPGERITFLLPDEVHAYRPTDGKYPDLTKLVDNFDTGNVTDIRFNPSFLADVNKVPHDRGTIRIEFQDPTKAAGLGLVAKPARFTCTWGEVTWTYLLMPARDRS